MPFFAKYICTYFFFLRIFALNLLMRFICNPAIALRTRYCVINGINNTPCTSYNKSFGDDENVEYFFLNTFLSSSRVA